MFKKRNLRKTRRRNKLIQTWTLRILIGIAVIFSIALTIMLAISFGLYISKP